MWTPAENREFHTFVYDGPIFRRPVGFQREIVYRDCIERMQQLIRYLSPGLGLLVL